MVRGSTIVKRFINADLAFVMFQFVPKNGKETKKSQFTIKDS